MVVAASAVVVLATGCGAVPQPRSIHDSKCQQQSTQSIPLPHGDLEVYQCQGYTKLVLFPYNSDGSVNYDAPAPIYQNAVNCPTPFLFSESNGCSIRIQLINGIVTSAKESCDDSSGS